MLPSLQFTKTAVSQVVIEGHVLSRLPGSRSEKRAKRLPKE